MLENHRLALMHTLAAAVAGGVAAAFLGAIHLRPADVRYLPDPKQTPGAVIAVTAEQVCVPGYATKARGSLSDATKREVCRRYGLHYPLPHGKYEYDHFVSIELGGDPKNANNIWPQSYAGLWNAHQKDALEDRLHKLVCDGTITLAEAQREIRADWVAAYEKWISN